MNQKRNSMPTIVVPNDPKKRLEMIAALEYQLVHDTSEKDKEIHSAALKKLKASNISQ